MYDLISQLMDEVNESRSLLNVAGFSLTGDVDHDCLSTTLAIVEGKMEKVLEQLEKLLDLSQKI